MVTGENLFAVSAPDAKNAWMVGFNAIIVHTADGGVTWAIQNGGVTLPLRDVSFGNPRTGWIAGDRGTILHTSDGGATWKKVKNPLLEERLTLYKISAHNGTV